MCDLPSMIIDSHTIFSPLLFLDYIHGRLLTRIVSPENNPVHADGMPTAERRASLMDDPPHGIASDRLAHFAVAFSALIHDADHRGVPNFVLAGEEADMAERYRGRALAEQNSVDLAWGVLMGPDYQDLRRCIYTTPDELRRFRQLVVNAVMATDIFDADAAAARKDRWSMAFEQTAEREPKSVDDDSRRATVVLEHLIQASDVAHTMQHWVRFPRGTM
jgi:3'5'-cyclic nucleotide phosphodiesterase